MKVSEAMYICMRKCALNCALKYRFAIPNKIIDEVLEQFPKLGKDRKELMDEIRKVCIEVNKLKDNEIRLELEKNFFEDTIIK